MRRRLIQLIQYQQHGAALLVFAIILFLASASWLLAHASKVGRYGSRDQLAFLALNQAKQALIGRATMDFNRPGSLPCPDTNDDGVAESFVSNECPSYIGRLPWKTLGLPRLADSQGEALWYALSKGLRDNDLAQPINPLKSLELQLDGIPNVAAIVIAPGGPLKNQNGRPSNSPTDYLDESNSDGDFNYRSGPESETFNDKILPITRENLFNIVNRKVLWDFAGLDGTTGLGEYYKDHANNYPPATASLKEDIHFISDSKDGTTGDAIDKNGWFSLVSYNVDAGNQVATLTIAPPPSVTCTVTPHSASGPGKMSCTRP